MERKATFLFLVRHGETEGNLQQRYQGQKSGVGLNEKGREQARLMARRLAGLTLHAAYSSDLRRAKECAEIIAAPHNLKVKALSGLRERNFGALEGLSREEAETRPWWREIEESEGFLAAPGGETRSEMRRRVLECMNEIIASHEGESVLIVAHGGPISQMVSDLLGGPPERRAKVRLDNCSLTVIMAEGKKRTLLLLNDVGHLFPEAPVGVLAAMEEETTVQENSNRRERRGRGVKINEITKEVIGAALTVHQQLGPGLLESTYEECLAREFALRKVPFERQKAVPLIYKEMPIDVGFRVDFVVAEQVIVELKAVDAPQPVHEAQLLTYLKLTGLQVGLLINFNVKRLRDGIRRLVLNFDEQSPLRTPRPLRFKERE